MSENIRLESLFKEGNVIHENRHDHLKKGVTPIMACIGTAEDFGQQYLILDNHKYDSENVTNVNWDNPFVNESFKHCGFNSYTISGIDASFKCSEGFYRCTGIVVVGLDKETGKNISFMTHQDPKKILYESNDQFDKDLSDRLKDLLTRSEKGTVDAVIFGGNVSSYIGVEDSTANINYRDSIKKLSCILRERLGFNPLIITGPKNRPLKGTPHAHFDSVFFDTDHRRLFIIRPENANNKSFKLY